MKSIKPIIAFCSIAIAASALVAKDKKDLSEIGHRRVASGPNFYSVEKEIALGQQLALEVQRQARIVEDPMLSEYVNRLCQNLARNSDVAFPVSLKIIESDDVNAFTLPGGFLFINTGLIRLTETEGELAAALSHELAHVAARHATRQATRNEMLNIAALPLGTLGGLGGVIARQVASLGIPLGFLKFSRAFESEADLLGLEYLYQAGYDPNASVDLFERLEAAERRKPGSVSRLFNTHPLTADRLQKTQENIAELLPGKPQYVITTSDYEDMRKRLIRLQNPEKVEAVDRTRPKSRRRVIHTDGSESEERPVLHRMEE